MHSKNVKKCPKCEGDNISILTRIVGYFSKTRNWLPSKKQELEARRKGDYKLK